MFGLDLFHFSPPLEDAAEAFVIILAAFILSRLVFNFAAAPRHHRRSCLEDGKCRPTVIAGQRVLRELQDSMSETGRDKRLKSSKRKGAGKKTDPPKDFRSEGARGWGKNAPGEKQRKEKKALERRSLYPVKELEAVELDSSETDELSSSEEEDLEDEGARYEEERYGSRWRATVKTLKVMDPLWARLIILIKLHRVILIRFDRGRLPENLFRRIKQKDISILNFCLQSCSVSLPHHL
ncbi:uncharacterized protein LOC134486235 [Rattus norvegicus]|uniref:uncharacterized protein LOC134486235 n=1 Tax=Rattus norvegicus TaxID=10116 RepID=UPI002FD81BB5